MVATDAESITSMLNPQVDDIVGKSMWKNSMNRIGKTILVDEYSTQQTFEDTMLDEWVQFQGKPKEKEKLNGLIIQPLNEKPALPVVQEGTIYRTSHPIILDEQVFHESLVLILKSDERGIIGAILNRPSAKGAILANAKVPLRYGGRYGLEKEGKPETWLHCGNEALRNAKVGVPVVPEDELLIWQCSREDAETAVEIGLAAPSDFMAILGLTLWEKNPPPEGFGVPLTKTNLEKDFLPVPKSRITSLWKELLHQEILTELSLAKNLGHSRAAYCLASRISRDKRSLDLADDALERWIKIFLMKADEKS